MSYYWGGLHPDIIGRTLVNVEVSPDRDRLKLTFADGTTDLYRTEGDCCSETWIEHLTVPPDIAGSVITAIPDETEVEATPEQQAECETHRDFVDVLRVYQSVIRTSRGDVVIEYRNDSNGYYGGNLQRVVVR